MQQCNKKIQTLINYDDVMGKKQNKTQTKLELPFRY